MMPHTREEVTPNLAERLCWEVGRRDDARVARRLYSKPVVDGVYRLDEGALLAEFFHGLRELGVMTLLEEVGGIAMHWGLVPFVQSLLRYGLKTLVGVKSRKALPALVGSEEAFRRLVGFNAQQVREGGGQRGRTTRQGQRSLGPLCPDTLAKHMVKGHVRDLDALLNGGMRALAKAGGFGKRITGMADGPDVETTARYRGGGQVTRKCHIEAKQGKVHQIEVSVYGWTVLLLIEAVPKMPLAVKVVQIQAHEALWTRAVVTQARTNGAGSARLHKLVFERGVLAGPDRWWLDQQGTRCSVPAKDTLAVTAEARALAAAGEGGTVGRRVPTGRHGQGRTAWTERLETEVVGITGLTTYEPSGTEEHGRQPNRRDFQPNPINAVVVRQWQGKDEGPKGTTVFLTNAAVQQPLQPFDDDDDRRLMEHGCSKEAKQPWDLKHPPQNTARAVRVHVLCTLLLFALATAYRRQSEQPALGGEPVGWQRCRRQLLEQTRDHVIVFAQGDYGMFHLAVFAFRMGVKLKDVPPGLRTYQDILAKYGLPPKS